MWLKRNRNFTVPKTRFLDYRTSMKHLLEIHEFLDFNVVTLLKIHGIINHKGATLLIYLTPCG